MQVNGIKVKELPAVDDEFAQEVSEFDTLDEYKADIKAKLLKEKEDEAARAKEDAVIGKIIEELRWRSGCYGRVSDPSDAG